MFAVPFPSPTGIAAVWKLKKPGGRPLVTLVTAGNAAIRIWNSLIKANLRSAVYVAFLGN
jgi:hypothetical protein